MNSDVRLPWHGYW
jgi:hypothetical protein